MASKQPIFTKQEFITTYNQKMQTLNLNGFYNENDKKNEDQLKRFWAVNEAAWGNNKVSLETAVNEAIADSKEDTTTNFINALHANYNQLDFKNEDYKKKEEVAFSKLDSDTKKEIWEKAKQDLQALQNIEDMLNSNTEEAKEYKNALTKLIHIYSGGTIKLREWFYRGQKTTEKGTIDLF